MVTRQPAPPSLLQPGNSAVSADSLNCQDEMEIGLVRLVSS